MYGVQPAPLILIVIASFCLYYCNAQTGVCYRPVSRQTSSVGYTRGSYTQGYGCGLFNWRRCRRTLYRSNSRTTYSAAYSSQFGCCAGYIVSGGNRCTPVCSPACANGGTCTAPNRCSCSPGWTGSTCGTDINECASSSSNNCQQLCSNTPGSYTCSCRSGYRLNSDRRTCAEIHECNEGTDLCDQNCANTQGSYTCSCNSGYTLSTNGRSCLNNDECMLGTDRCTQTCHDTPGSYMCSCRAGYSLDSDGFTCNDIDECAAGTDTCEQNCHNSVGSYDCSCNIGYTLNSDSRTCDDFNECNINNGGCAEICVNTRGTHSCRCNAGYALDSDMRGCSDVDECAVGSDNCAQNCQNTVGSFTCSCNAGYTLAADGFTCNDNNECADPAINNCQYMCRNLPGSFVCTCRSGYALNTDQTTCSDINECVAGTHACAQNCINTVGSYTCSCNDGYTMNPDGRSCDDINECAAGTDQCSYNCVNIPGSYNCTCRIGYRLDTDGFTCIDIDECAEDSALCAQDCNNTIGSYTCSCRTGFIIDENGYSCDDIDECGGDHMCEVACNNTAGSFHCACLAGYTINADGRTCGDLDECEAEVDECDQTCHNNVGSYTCSCGAGFTLNSDGFRCDDVNECLSGRIGNTTCLEVCVNTPGSWRCGCNPGYTLNTDGMSCRDEDECTGGVNPCDQQCSNTIGSYTCSCNSSTTLNPDGFRCDDIDECQMDLDNCAEVCVNTYGTYHCACNIGYTLNADGITCRDANECEDGTHTCEQLCNNAIGSYTCGCNPGYILTSNLINCLGSPQDVTFGDLQSTTATVLWGTPVNDSGDGNILSYTVDCSSETDRNFGLTMTTQASQERRVLLRNLRPYMVYNCCVSVRTDTATSPNSCTAQRTLEEAPNNPPRNISIENDDPYSLTFDFAPPLVPNGVITAYTFYARFDNGTSIVIVDRTLTGRFVLRNLQPYQLVTIEVSANTSAGEGPKSDVDEIRTAQAAPSMPTGLVVDVLSNSSILIRWDPPAMANGVLRNYTIRVYNVFNNFTKVMNILSTDVRSVSVGDLAPFIPYTVNVRASTIAGEGEPIRNITFTEHGVPDVPTLLNVVRISNRLARVFWIPLTLDEARGVLTSLQIAYEPARNGTCTTIDEEDMQLMTITESLHTQSEAVIDGLLSTEEYCVAIQVSTRAGESGFSNVLRGHLPSNTNIQIRLKLSDTSCSSYITENLAQKSTDISSAIVQEILSNCQCPYSLDYVTHSRLLCGSNDREIIYQSNLLHTDGAQATELREMVQTWVNTNPMISVGGVSQQVDSYCQINVKDIGHMECEAMNPTEVDSTESAVTKDLNVPAIVGGVVGGFLGTVLLVAGIMAVLYAFNRPNPTLSFKSHSKNGEDDLTRLVERNVKMENTVSSETPAEYDEVPSYQNPTYTDMSGKDSSLVKPSSEGEYEDILPYNSPPNDA